MRRLLRRLRPTLRQDLEAVMRAIVARRSTRRVANVLYRHLPGSSGVAIYDRFAKIFRGSTRAVETGTWTVGFAGRTITLPLTAERMWLDWDAALSLVGHEPEIKTTYAAMLRHRRPDFFVDVGANYGGHSLIFACHGVRHVSIEPNRTCHQYAREAAALNGVEAAIVPSAVGAERTTATLVFPAQETWLGSIVRASAAASGPDLTALDVDVVPLDDLVDAPNAQQILLKIDVEGAELEVLRGARRLLETRSPTVIFESLAGSDDRADVAALLAACGYAIALLPWDCLGEPRWVEPAAFPHLAETNYLAIKR